MNKLTNEQRKVLVECLETNAALKRNVKPIHVHQDAERAKIDEFAPAYARYNKQMYKLLDAGLIARRPADTRSLQWVDCYCYIADAKRVAVVLEAGVF